MSVGEEGLPSEPVGRTFELGRIDAFMEDVQQRGSGALLSGDAGIGKSTLLRAAVGRARDRGFQVVRAEGVEFESQLSYAALNQILLPLRANLDHVETALRVPLRVALGLESGAAATPLVIGNACLAALRDAAVDRPLLIVVDDVQWIDRASALVLGFVVRRVEGMRVGLLMAARSGEAALISRAVAFEHEIAALAPTAAHELLSARAPRLSEAQRTQIVTYAQGNPLALVELSRVRSASGGSFAAEVDALPLSDRLRGLYSARVGDLSTEARRLMLLAALESSGDLVVLQAAAQSPRWLESLRACENAALLRVDAATRRLTFDHPLIRSAVITLCTAAERRAAHRALSDALVTDPARQAWHLAEAADAPDEAIAAALDDVATAAFGRGDSGGASAAMIRAAELSPHTDDRARRLAKAAWFGAVINHDPAAAQRLLSSARHATPSALDTLFAAATLPHLYLAGQADPDVAHRALVKALDAVKDDGGEPSDAVLSAMQSQQVLAWYTQRTDIWEAHRSMLDRLGARAPASEQLAQAFLRGAVAPQLALLGLLDHTLDGLDSASADLHVLSVAPSAQCVDRLSLCRGALWRIVDSGSQTAASLLVMLALEHLIDDAVVAGRWSEAARLLERARANTQHEEMLLVVGVRYQEAELAARRGDRETVLRISEDTLDWAAPMRARVVELQFHIPRALDHLAHAEWDEAYDELIQVMPAGKPFSELPFVPALTLDFVEAAAYSGHADEAREHAAIMRAAGCAHLSSRLDIIVGAADAVVARDEEAPRLFAEILVRPALELWPFERARVELAYGLRLRRMRNHVAARRHLDTARLLFARLGSPPWAARAADGLRATGHALVRNEPGSSALTAQELEIARLAARGLTNRQIGDRLLMSHRTVAAHLYHVFPKLGIGTRAALADALSAYRR